MTRPLPPRPSQILMIESSNKLEPVLTPSKFGQVTNEVELVGSEYVYDNYLHPYQSARRNFLLAFGALLHRFYIEDLKEDCIQMGINLLEGVFSVEPDHEAI